MVETRGEVTRERKEKKRMGTCGGHEGKNEEEISQFLHDVRRTIKGRHLHFELFTF